MDTTDIARICHEVNRVICEAFGDFSQTSWEEAPNWQKESAVNGVLTISQNPDFTPEDSHENWVLEKIYNGWTYGIVKDAERKTHPCLVPYEQLPPEQRVKDCVFLALVTQLKNS